jgi:hypothetical protein
MNQALIDKIVQAVLYEGYILYPYRASSKKNRQRFTFGRVYPERYSLEQKGVEPCAMQTQCLVRATSPEAALEVIVRFLHPTIREIGALAKPIDQLATPELRYSVVPEVKIEGTLYQGWQEAVEREIRVPLQKISEPISAPKTHFKFPTHRTVEPILNGAGETAAVIIRTQEELVGFVELALEPVDASVSKITVRIVNQTPIHLAVLGSDAAIVCRTFASTHTILHAHGGEFISQIDPPADYAKAAENCIQIGTWPVLVGEEEKQERDTMISSPIILYDYPQIAPESPGTLFDGGEIDEILTLRIMTMTDEEKSEMRNVDIQAREILERTENLDEEQLLEMHGAMRETTISSRSNATVSETIASTTENFFNPATKPQSFLLKGVSVKTGDRVRVRPKSRADIMDMALAGKIAIIESIEQDAEDQIHLALIMEDDPGKDLGYLKQPGHRFFYTTEEVELLGEGE